jgi:hypothetical protein
MFREAVKEIDRTGASSNDKGAIAAPSARSGSLDNVDGNPDCRAYSESLLRRQVHVAAD